MKKFLQSLMLTCAIVIPVGLAAATSAPAHAQPQKQMHVVKQVQQAKRTPTCGTPNHVCIWASATWGGCKIEITSVTSPTPMAETNWLPFYGDCFSFMEYAASGYNRSGHDLWEHHNDGSGTFCVDPGQTWSDSGRPAEWQTTSHTVCSNDSNPGGW